MQFFLVNFQKWFYLVAFEIPLKMSGQPSRESRYSRSYGPKRMTILSIKMKSLIQNIRGKWLKIVPKKHKIPSKMAKNALKYPQIGIQIVLNRFY